VPFFVPRDSLSLSIDFPFNFCFICEYICTCFAFLVELHIQIKVLFLCTRCENYFPVIVSRSYGPRRRIERERNIHEMSDSIDLRSVAKFDGSNFQAWKFRMKAVFVANGLTDVIKGTSRRPSENMSEWDRNNAKAMVIISSTMESAQLEYLLTCKTAADMWKRLSTAHEQKSESNKLLLMTKFHDYKMAMNDNIV